MLHVWREVVRCKERSGRLDICFLQGSGKERSDLDIWSEVVVRHKFEGKLKITIRREVVV